MLNSFGLYSFWSKITKKVREETIRSEKGDFEEEIGKKELGKEKSKNKMCERDREKRGNR